MFKGGGGGLAKYSSLSGAFILDTKQLSLHVYATSDLGVEKSQGALGPLYKLSKHLQVRFSVSNNNSVTVDIVLYFCGMTSLL